VALDDSDGHDNDVKGLGDDGYNKREPLSEDIELVRLSFSQSKISSTVPTQSHSHEWLNFQMPAHYMESAGMQTRFDPAFTPYNHEVLAPAQFRAPQSPNPYSTSPTFPNETSFRNQH